MHYSITLDVPANTPLITPVTGAATLPAGIIKHTTIVFPPGCSRMVKAIILDDTTQIMPKNADEVYAEDAYHFEIGEFYIMDTGRDITLSAYSPGTGYKHTLTAHFEVVSLEEMAMGRTGYY